MPITAPKTLIRYAPYPGILPMSNSTRINQDSGAFEIFLGRSWRRLSECYAYQRSIFDQFMRRNVRLGETTQERLDEMSKHLDQNPALVEFYAESCNVKVYMPSLEFGATQEAMRYEATWIPGVVPPDSETEVVRYKELPEKYKLVI